MLLNMVINNRCTVKECNYVCHIPFNRDLSNIRGFTRETLNAVIANIESREWRRQYCIRNGIPLEHPRASTTDDVECFFSVLRDNVGKHFTLREVMKFQP